MGCRKLSYYEKEAPEVNALFLVKGLEKKGNAEKNRVNYYPFGLEHRGLQNQQIGAEHPYTYQGKQKHEDFGWNVIQMDWRNYQPDLGRFFNVDPFAEQRSWMTPYNFVQNSPIIRVDPTGLLDGWVQGADGEIFWDENTNSQEEFEQNYEGQEGYEYVSDSDNPNSYTLPSGEGSLVLSEWTTFDVEDGMGFVVIDLTFNPNDESAEVGWTQTFSTNQPYLTDENKNDNPQQDQDQEFLDGLGVQFSQDVTKARYFQGYSSDDHGKPGTRLHDGPARFFDDSSNTPLNFYAQSTVLLNGKRALSLKWGFTLTSLNKYNTKPPTIVTSTTDFHNQAVEELSKKIND